MRVKSEEVDMSFNDRYFPRVDLSDKGRYKYYKYKNRDFAYDVKDKCLIYLYKDSEEIDDLGSQAPWRELDSISLSLDNWKDKESRDSYLDEYIDDFEDMSSRLVNDFVNNELPLYDETDEELEPDIDDEDSNILNERIVNVLEDTNSYKYGKYIIVDSHKDGLWYVINPYTHEIIDSFSTSEDAEDYINNYLS